MRLKDKKKSTIINDRVKFLNVDKFYISKYVLYFNWFGYFNKDDTDWVIIGTTMRILVLKINSFERRSKDDLTKYKFRFNYDYQIQFFYV